MDATTKRVAWEGATQERRGDPRGTVSDADPNGSKPPANHGFVVEVP